MPLRIVFFGTPAFAVPSLEALAAAGHLIVGVVTQPDRPRGRGQRVLPSEVKTAGLALGAPIFQPTRLKDEDFGREIRSLGSDLGVVAAYGRILPADQLALPRLGMINVHASLLPRWRGAAPVHRAILAGDEITGVTIMRVVQQLDAGPMLAKITTPIAPGETSEALETRLAHLGADLLVTTARRMAAGPITEEAQDEAMVTYAARLERRESAFDWAQPASTIHNRIRGLQPWPLAAGVLQGRRILLRASVPLPNETPSEAPGTIVRIERDAMVVATSPGAIRLVSVQLEGKAPMTVAAFLHGHRVQPGERFETAAAQQP